MPLVLLDVLRQQSRVTSLVQDVLAAEILLGYRIFISSAYLI